MHERVRQTFSFHHLYLASSDCKAWCAQQKFVCVLVYCVGYVSLHVIGFFKCELLYVDCRKVNGYHIIALFGTCAAK